MNLNFKIEDVTVLTKKKNLSKDGQKRYHSLGIMVGDDLGELPCTEEVYDLAERGVLCSLQAVYNGTYKFVNIVGISL